MSASPSPSLQWAVYPALLTVPHAEIQGGFVVLGYAAPGDGGAAMWVALEQLPVPGGVPTPGLRNLGGRWFRCACHGPLDPRALGARGDGITDDTAALTETAALSGDVVISRGRYAVDGVVVEMKSGTVSIYH